MKRVKLKHVFIILAPLLLLTHLLAASHLFALRNSVKYKNQIDAPLIPKTMMLVMAGEFKGLASDFLLMEISAFLNGVGESMTPEKWDRVAFHFSQVMALDPYFRQTYVMVQATLPWQGKVQEANALLEISKQHLPWDWYPGFYIGFNYFHFLNDYANAAKYLTETSKIAGAPAVLATLGAKLSQKAGQTRAAIAFLKTMLQNPDYDANAKRIIELRIAMLEGAALLEGAATYYEKLYGHPIDSLDDLVTSGILKQLPKHPEGRQYTYQNGKVGF